MSLVHAAGRGARRMLRRAGWDLVRASGLPDVQQFRGQFGRRAVEAESTVGRFVAEDGVEFPVFRFYRYGVKLSWRMIPELSGLHHLRQSGCLSAEQLQRFESFIGERTLNAALNEISEFSWPVLRAHRDRFEPESVEHGQVPVPRLDDEALRRAVSEMARGVAAHIALAPSASGSGPLKVLDVGCGRGISTAALASLGYLATGIDNDYGGVESGLQAFSLSGTHRRLQELLAPSVAFLRSSITSCPELPDETFDLIYSASVLEHVQDIEAATAEMWRVLKPRGVMIHSYNPFWAFNGGHAFGTLDAPWLHAMLSADDHLRYMDELCPLEAPAAKPWIAGALNRRLTIAAMQGAVLGAGFDLLRWEESFDKPRHLETFSPSYLQLVHRHQTDVTLADMLATSVVFVARKRDS